MALWSVDIQKHYGAEYWTNRYIVNAPDITTANVAAATIVNAERQVHLTVVQFDRYRTSDQTPGTDVYHIETINLPGLMAVSGDIMPLFNVIRVDFTVEAGRPSRKYLRCPVLEAWSDNGAVASASKAFIQTNYVDVLVSLGAFVDVDGQEIIGGQVHPDIGMRQLRRGSKRRTTPII